MVKSHVSMEQHVCPVCGAVHDTGAILLDKRLRESLERHTLTGRSLCPQCTERAESGMIALVGVDPERSAPPTENGNMDPNHAYRTGRIAWLRREIWSQLLDAPLPDVSMVFVEDGVLDVLERIKAGGDHAD